MSGTQRYLLVAIAVISLAGLIQRGCGLTVNGCTYYVGPLKDGGVP